MKQQSSIEFSLQEIPQEKLERLLDIYGIASEFIDFSGNIIQTSLRDRLAILEAMGVSFKKKSEVDFLLESEVFDSWQGWLQPVVFLQLDRCAIELTCHAEESKLQMSWHITLEDGSKLEGTFIPDEMVVQDSFQSGNKFFTVRSVPLPALPLGYHLLKLDNGERWVSSTIMVTPSQTYQPRWLQEEKRIWGISAQLYALCSEHNWGIGDFSDLCELIELSANTGADFIMLNPLHALDIKFPEDASPYSPIDRRFLNPLYIDPCIEEDFINSTEVQNLISEPGFKDQLDQLRGGTEVDYTHVFAMKHRIFDLMFRYFSEVNISPETAARKSYEEYINSHNEEILTFAKFQAEIPLQGVDSCHDINFHLYLQWLADKQLTNCQTLATQQGMKIGLVRDLAVGGNSKSCEVLTNPDLFCLDARIGAPPDHFNPDGQNWGLPPIRPDVLKKTNYKHFISLLRENMTSCGALRVDHVMALMRLWWCVETETGMSGCYVNYPVKELFGILRIESQRAQCLIIGEDLGVVPPEIRSHIADSGILSNVVFYFEKYDGWHFKKPADYPKKALAIVANHDVPTLKAWWNINDLALRMKLGLIVSASQLESDREYRQHEKRQVLDWLEEASLLPEEWLDKDIEKAFDVSLCSAIFRNCASSSSLMLSVQFDDIAGLATPVNIPGTSTEYPNWRRKVLESTKTLFASSDTQQMLSGIQRERP